jgi:hypothetical protein
LEVQISVIFSFKKFKLRREGKKEGRERINIQSQVTTPL